MNLVEQTKRLNRERKLFERWMHKNCDPINLSRQYGTPISMVHQPDGQTVDYTPGAYADPAVQGHWEEWLSVKRERRHDPEGLWSFKKTAFTLGWAHAWLAAVAVGFVLVAKHYGWEF